MLEEYKRVLEELHYAKEEIKTANNKISDLEQHQQSNDKKTVEIDLRSEHVTLANMNTELTMKLDTCMKRLEGERAINEEKIISLQQSQSRVRALERSLEEVSMLCESLKATVEDGARSVFDVQVLLQARDKQIAALEADLDRMKDKTKDANSNLAAASFLKAEQDSLTSALRRDLKASINSKEELLKRIKVLEEYRATAEGQLVSLVEHKERAENAQTVLDEANSATARLRLELHHVETQGAVRATRLTVAENQVECLRRELSEKEGVVRDSAERLAVLQSKIDEVDRRVETAAAQHAKAIEVCEEQIKLTLHTCAAEKKALLDSHAVEIESMQKDFSKRSASARIMLAERDTAAATAQSLVTTLQEEIKSGAPSERKIFELAQMQAKREAAIGAGRDSRDIAFLQLQSALAVKDLELGQLQGAHHTLAAEVTDLRRVTRREGVNMDYLKNIVLQVPLHTTRLMTSDY